MLRTEPQANANALLRALALSAHHYEEAANLLGGPMGDTLAHISKERDALVARLSDAIRRTGDLPDVLDPERVGLSDLGLRARRLLHGREGLLNEALADEDAALTDLALIAARGVPEVKAIADRIRAQVEATEGRLHRH